MQLQPIQAGAAFRAISERVGFVELEGIRRQRGPAWQRQAALDFARGRTREGLQAYAAHGAVRFHDTVEQAHTQIVTDWMAAHAQGSVLILAHANNDVEALNAGVRAARKAAGELDGPEIQFETARGLKGFAVGDRVLFLKNEVDVKNGMLGTVEGLGIDTLTVRTDRGLVVTLKPSEYQSFSHGYAATVHKAQGATVDRTLVYASALMNRHLTYVALTRHRDDAVLYAAKQAFASVQDLAHTLSRDGSSSTTLDHDFMRQRVPVADLFPPSNDREARAEAQVPPASPTSQSGAPAPARAATPEEMRAAGPAPRPAPDPSRRDALQDGVAAVQPKPSMAAQETAATVSRRGPRPRIMIHAVPVPSDRSASAAQLEVRVKTDPDFHRARHAMRLAIGAVWITPAPIVKDIEARFRAGEDVTALVDRMRARPEQVGALRGREEARGLLTRLLPESAAAVAERIERGAAREDAVFAAAQVGRAASVWRAVWAQEQARQATRDERLSHAVPSLSDRAHGLLRAFAEALEASPEAARLAASRAHDRRELTAELLQFDAALTRRFGAAAFTDQAQDRFEDDLGPRNLWAAEVLKVLGPQVRRFAAAQAEVAVRLQQAPSAVVEERIASRSAAVEPLFPALTRFDQSAEEAAHQAVMTSARFKERLERVAAAARIVFRDPDRAMAVLVAALPDGPAFDRMLNPLFDSPAALTATLGELAGTKGVFVSRADRQARVAAEQTVKRFLVEARDLQMHHAGAVRFAVEAERTARAAAAIPVPGLSEEAKQLLDQLQGVAPDRILDQYGILGGSLAARSEVRAFSEAVVRKFGYDLSLARVAPQPTAAQRAAFERERSRLETAQTLGRRLAGEQAKVQELVRGLRHKNDLTR